MLTIEPMNQETSKQKGGASLGLSALLRRCEKLQGLIGQALAISETLKDVKIPTELNGKQIPADLLAQCDMSLQIAQMQMLGVFMVLRVEHAQRHA